jgi:glycosyltransferase involved in cell wall biosynthesis
MDATATARDVGPLAASPVAGAGRPAPPAVELTILMPCLNEALTLETCIRKAQRFLSESGIAGEVLVADNGSTDGSPDIARGCGARVVSVPTRGYGAALSHGTKQARGKFIIAGDSDDSYDLLGLAPFVEALRAGCDLVVGNRFLGGIRTGAMPWKNRWFGNPGLTAIGRLFFRSQVGDFYCGLRGYSAEAFARMDLRATGMEFAVEMVAKAALLKMRVVEVPTTLSPDGRNRPPHLRPWLDGWRTLNFMLLYSPRWLFLYPGMAMTLLGGSLTVALLFGRIRIGAISFDVDTIVFASAMILIGFQSMLFWNHSKVFAVAEGLLPAEDNRLGRRFTPELGLIAGTGLLVLGAGGGVFAVESWGRHSFGEMNTEALLRIVTPAALAMTLGVQLILSGFFLSLLQMRTRR